MFGAILQYFRSIVHRIAPVYLTIAIWEDRICLEVSPNNWKHFGFQDTYLQVLFHVSIQYVELEFPSAMESIRYRNSATACLYSRQDTLIG